MDESNKNAFDRLVAGLNAEERTEMLTRLNSNDIQNVEISSNPVIIDNFKGTLTIRLKGESIFYKFILWVRSLFSQTTVQAIYNDDVLSSLAKKINREHPGLLNVHAHLLDSLFYEQLTGLKAAADFFKPYYYKIAEDQGDFFVFLSSFVAPEISEQINEKVDPYNLLENENPTNDARTILLRELDDYLKNIPLDLKAKMYNAVKSVQWLESFASLSLTHFIAQFTDVKSDSFTCPYTSAKIDYESVASVFDNIISVPNEVLQSIFLFSQKKDSNGTFLNNDVNAAAKEFMTTANTHLSSIKLFLSIVPVSTMGKIIFSDYDWTPKNIGGSEDWFAKFRTQWRKIFDIRWTDFLHDKKKTVLSEKLFDDFGLNAIPEMPDSPWETLWGGVPFEYDMTGGFLAWYCTEKFKADQATLNTLLMEGVFQKNENRTEFDEAFNIFIGAANDMIDLLKKIEPKGQYGAIFEDLEGTSSRVANARETCEKVMSDIEFEIKLIVDRLCNSTRTMETVFKGIFNESTDGVHAALQNINLLKGHGSLKFKDELANVRHNLKQILYYVAEFEPIEKQTKRNF